jgi:hypothetical protein
MLLDHFDVSFYINLPVGAITIATTAWLLPAPKQLFTTLPPREKLKQLLPLMLSVILDCLICGGIVTWVGYYTPFIIISAAIFAMEFPMGNVFFGKTAWISM